jgi:hypothetical protein
MVPPPSGRRWERTWGKIVPGCFMAKVAVARTEPKNRVSWCGEIRVGTPPWGTVDWLDSIGLIRDLGLLHLQTVPSRKTTVDHVAKSSGYKDGKQEEKGTVGMVRGRKVRVTRPDPSTPRSSSRRPSLGRRATGASVGMAGGKG